MENGGPRDDERTVKEGSPLAVGLAALGCMAGCYLSHGREAPLGSGSDASPGTADAGSAIDAGAPVVGTDAGEPPAPPLPDDEPDVAPDERPSDGPDADEWMDPPSGFGVCCDVGGVVGIDDIERQASEPRVAWDGSEWGVTWGDVPALAPSGIRRLVLRRIDADARPTLDLVTVDERGASPTAMAFGNHRFAITTETGRDAYRPGRLVVIDREGRIRDERTFPDELGGAVVTRHPAVHGWATVATESDPEGDSSTRSHLLVFDESLAEIARRELEPVHTDSRGGSAIVASKSVLVVASGETNTVIRTYRGAAIEEVDATDVGRLGSELAGAAFRDTAVLAGRELGRGPLFTLVWDPFERRVISPPRNVGPTRSGSGLSIAADSIGGTLGLCYPTGGGEGVRDPDAVTFVLVGPDGAPIGLPVVVASGFRYVASCAVASAGPDTYVVVFWNAARDSPRHSILAVRVSVRR